jgi:hypothetical protein
MPSARLHGAWVTAHAALANAGQKTSGQLKRPDNVCESCWRLSRASPVPVTEIACHHNKLLATWHADTHARFAYRRGPEGHQQGPEALSGRLSGHFIGAQFLSSQTQSESPQVMYCGPGVRPVQYRMDRPTDFSQTSCHLGNSAPPA